MEKDQKPDNKLGLYIVGQIIGKNHFPGKDGKPDRYSIDVAIPGIREMLTVSLQHDDWVKRQEMTPVSMKAVFSLFRGRLYFQPARS